MPGDPWQPEAPILEFDPAPSAVIEPGEVIEPIDVPLHVVLCFFQDVITTVVEELGGRALLDARHPVEVGEPAQALDHVPGRAAAAVAVAIGHQ